MDSNYSLNQIEDNEWDTLVEECEYSGFMQLAAWGEVKKVDNWSSFRLGFREGGIIQAAALVLSTRVPGTDKKMLYSPQGPMLNWHGEDRKKRLRQIGELVRDLAKQENALCWRIEPWLLQAYSEDVFDEYTKSPVDMQPRHTALIPLIKSEEDILKSFHSKTRYNIGLAARRGAHTVSGNSAKLFQDFLQCYHATVERKSIETKDDQYFQAIQKYLGKKYAFVVVAYKEEKPIAAILLIKCGNRLTYFFGGFDYESRRDMAPFACHFEAIKLGKSLGCQFYDLWGISGSENPEHPWQNFTEFKLKFSPIPVTLSGAYDLVFDAKSYEDVILSSS